MDEEESPAVSDDDKKYIQQVLDIFLYSACSVNLTILQALNTIAAEQSHPTEHTLQRVKQVLDYMATNPDAIIRYLASNMVLNVHSKASFHSASRMRSRAGE